MAAKPKKGAATPGDPPAGRPLAFEERGPAGAPPLLLLHGFLGSRRDWDPVAAALAGSRRCIAVDLPGHGETGAPADEGLWTPAGCVEALAALLKERGGGAVAGYSLGGRLALQLAAEHPKTVTRAVIVSATPGISGECGRGQRRAMDEGAARRLEGGGLDAFLKEWYEMALFAPLREHARFPQVLERRRRNDPRLLARSLRQMGAGAQPPQWDALPALRVPLLFLVGERDQKFTDIAFDAVARCPNAEAVVVRGRGHALVEEAPERVAQEIAGFLAAG
ncbi:MAG TPA: 2-succinyl-6-hydroxy-2,4-cyclohexadiene-1-carboxylate synthase [bacterium]